MTEATHYTNIRKELDCAKHRRINILKFNKKEDNTFDYEVVHTIYCDRLDKVEYEEDSIKIYYVDNVISGYRYSTYVITEDIGLVKIEVQ